MEAVIFWPCSSKKNERRFLPFSDAGSNHVNTRPFQHVYFAKASLFTTYGIFVTSPP